MALRRSAVALALAGALVASPGCVTSLMREALWPAPPALTPDTLVPVRHVDAWRIDDGLHLVVAYADGAVVEHVVGVAAVASGGLAGWPQPVAVRERAPAPGDDAVVVATDVGASVWLAGRPVAQVDLQRRVRRRPVDVASVGRRVAAALAIVTLTPVTLALDVGLAPLLPFGVVLWLATGQSLLIFG